MFLAADEIAPPGLDERFVHDEPVARLEELRQRALRLMVAQLPGRRHPHRGGAELRGGRRRLGNMWGGVLAEAFNPSWWILVFLGRPSPLRFSR
jgi:hypothetical protein